MEQHVRKQRKEKTKKKKEIEDKQLEIAASEEDTQIHMTTNESDVLNIAVVKNIKWK